MVKRGKEELVDALTFSDTRANLASVMDRVVEDHIPVVVTRRGREAVVMVALSEWNAIEETMHLRSTPSNADRLHDAIRQLDARKRHQQ